MNTLFLPVKGVNKPVSDNGHFAMRVLQQWTSAVVGDFIFEYVWEGTLALG